ncbi:hypothetical protein TC41_2788 [Alicyclobacillus acidocaldarius subsp. acidocaldarius Tc-4-1]|uniref:Uncharacterized protein n=1 Tax=Alicyclobacillus acidocaldarius (strain Tc-4-1) TaxID=1048834 RepID=F8IJG8_ALIAT|nr:hypothetical protein TC41_2788 [Alicyclobacillus acidocaldarius subsp. acidocaldarius Tc-4-1]
MSRLSHMENGIEGRVRIHKDSRAGKILIDILRNLLLNSELLNHLILSM